MGEIFMRGNLVMKGYLKNPRTTEASFKGGWFHSGDLAVWYEDGYCQIKDRSKDIIISGGENISSLELESLMFRHPKILEAAVVAAPDDKWGEVPCAFVCLKDGEQMTDQEFVSLLPGRTGRLQDAEKSSLGPNPERPRPAKSKNTSSANRPPQLSYISKIIEQS